MSDVLRCNNNVVACADGESDCTALLIIAKIRKRRHREGGAAATQTIKNMNVTLRERTSMGHDININKDGSNGEDDQVSMGRKT